MMDGCYTSPRLTFRFGFVEQLHDLGIGGVLPKGSHHITTLGVGDLHLTGRGPVEKGESFLEF